MHEYRAGLGKGELTFAVSLIKIPLPPTLGCDREKDRHTMDSHVSVSPLPPKLKAAGGWGIDIANRIVKRGG